MVKVGYVCGTCSVCGRKICRPRPAEWAVCDCWMYCPLDGERMEPYTPDLTPSQYDPDKGINVVMVHISQQDHPQPYYSKQKPIEVRLT